MKLAVELLEDRCLPAAGGLDLLFASGDKATFSLNHEHVNNVAVQPDGDVAVARLLIDNAPAKAAIFHGGRWFLDANASRTLGPGDRSAHFGASGDVPFTIDWGGDGLNELGVFRNGVWGFDVNGNEVWDSGDLATHFGTAGDRPVLFNWYGGGDRLGLFRAGWWFADANGTRSWDQGDVAFPFGLPGDVPVAGNFALGERREIAVFRGGVWYIDANTNGSWDGGDWAVPFGQPGDVPLAFDVNGDGYDEIGLFRGGWWYIDANRSFAWDAGDLAFPYGTLSAVPVAGNWRAGLPAGLPAGLSAEAVPLPPTGRAATRQMPADAVVEPLGRLPFPVSELIAFHQAATQRRDGDGSAARGVETAFGGVGGWEAVLGLLAMQKPQPEASTIQIRHAEALADEAARDALFTAVFPLDRPAIETLW